MNDTNIIQRILKAFCFQEKIEIEEDEEERLKNNYDKINNTPAQAPIQSLDQYSAHHGMKQWR